MLLSYSTWGMPTVPIDQAVSHCAGLGFDGLELTVIPGWITDGATLDAFERRRIRALYDRHGLALCGLCANTPLLDPDPAIHGENEARFANYLAIAADLQRPGEGMTVSTTAGGTPGDWAANKHRLVDQFGRFARAAEELGVVVGVEPHVAAAIHRPDQVIWLLDQIGSPALTIHFDISHFNVQGMNMDETIATLAPRSRHTHVKDERGVAPDFEFLIPGEGKMDYPRYLRGMAAAGYTGHIVVEISIMVQRRPGYDPLDAASQSYRVLADAFTNAGIARA